MWRSWLARTLWEREVVGSNPTTPTEMVVNLRISELDNRNIGCLIFKKLDVYKDAKDFVKLAFSVFKKLKLIEKLKDK